MTDYETIQRKRNITVGIFVIAALIALAGLVYEFGDLPVIVGSIKSFPVYIQFPMAPGVQKDTPVRFCGYQIGRVTKVRPPKIIKDLNTGKFYHQTVVELSINRKYKDIPEDVEVKLMTRGLGSSYIELNLTRFDVNEPTGPFLGEGSLLQGSTGITSEFFPEETQEKLDELVNGIKTLIDSTNDIVGDPNNKENLKKTLANLTEASQKATKTIEEFREFVASMISTSEELSKTATELRLILEKVNSGQGSAARFINDGRLYEDLLENTQQLQILLTELEAYVSEARENGLRIKFR